MKKNKIKKYLIVFLKFFFLFVIVSISKFEIERSKIDHAAAASVDHLEIYGDKPIVDVGETQTLTIYLDMWGTPAPVDYFENAVFSISPSATASCDGIPFGTSSTLDMTASPGITTCTLQIDTPGVFEIDLEGDVNDGWLDHYTTESDPAYDYHVTVNGPTVDHLQLSGSDTQISADSQTLTITAKDSSGDTITSYSGDKVITLSGPGPDGSKIPTCTDKNGSLIDVGNPTTLNFIDGVATCDLKLYKLGTVDVDADDGAFNSFGSADYDLGVEVFPNNLQVTGSSTQTAGTSQVITISAEDYNGDVINSYTGIKSITFSGPQPEGSNNPKCKDKDGNFRSFGDGTYLSFSSGSAICEMILYKEESTHVDADDGETDTHASPDYDLDVTVTSPPTEPNIYVNPLIINFGNLSSGETSERIITIKNTGEQTLTVADLYYRGQIGFEINPNGDLFPCGAGSFNLNYNQACTIGAKFSPPHEDLYSGVINIESNDPDSPLVQVALSGSQDVLCDHFNLIKHKDNKLTFDVCIPADTIKSSPYIDEDDNEGTSVEKISLETEEKIEGEFTIEYLEKKPEELEIDEKYESNSYVLYKYLEIDSDDFNNDDLRETELDLLIEKEWMEENNVVYIIFLHSEEEEPLDAELDEEDENYSYFDVFSDKFSPYWAIYGIKEEAFPKIYLNFLEHHFGKIEKGENSDPVLLEISNIGTADLDVSRIFLEDIQNFIINRNPAEDPCGNNKTLSPNENCKAEIIFTPKSNKEYTNLLFVDSNDPIRPTIKVVFTGSSNAVSDPPTMKRKKLPIIELSVIRHKFSNVILKEEGQEEKLTQDVRVYNRGEGDLFIDDIDITDKDEYRVDLNPPNSDRPCAKIKTLKTDESCDVRIIFKPKEEGEVTTVLKVKSNDPDHPVAEATFTGAAKSLKKTTNNKKQFAKEEEEIDPVNKSTIDPKQKTTPSSVELKNTFSLPEIFSLGLSLIALPFFQRRLKKAGVVFDAGSGKPISGASVELIAEDGKVKEVKSTDKTGNYFFLVTAGTYTVRVLADGYKMINNKEASYFSKYYDPYITHETKIITDKDNNVSFGFPLIPSNKKSLKYSILSKSGWLRIQDNLFWVGLAVAILITIFNPFWFNFIVLLIYGIFIVIKFLYPKKPKWGIVFNKEKLPQPLVYVTAEDSSTGNVARGITDGEGRYAILLPKGEYKVTADNNNGLKASINVSVNKEKILAKDIIIS